MGILLNPHIMAPSGYDIIILGGQSNMVGWDGPIDPVLDATNPRILQLKRNVGQPDDKTAILAADPLQHFSTTPNYIGLGLTLAKNYLATIPESRTVLLVPAARGNTGFIDGYWQPGDSCYTDLIERANAAMALGTGINRIVMIAWHQGENDNGLSQLRYTQYLDNHVAMLRRNITGLTNQTPFICGDLLSTQNASGGARLSLADVPSRIPYSAFVSSVGLVQKSGDSLHMSAASLRTNGLNYFNALSSAKANALAKTVPVAITDLSVIMGNGQAELTWTAPTSDTATLCNYLVQYKTSASSTWLDFNHGVFLNTIIKVGGLTNGTAYDFRVMGVNSVGVAPASNIVSGTPVAVSGNLTSIVSSCVIDFSAQIAASYDGTSQTWKNIAQGSSQPDAWLGGTSTSETNDPAFSGTAGNRSGKFVITSGDRFTLKHNTLYLQRIGRSDMSQQGSFTFHGKIASGNVVIAGSGKSFVDNSQGLSIFVATDGKISVYGYSGSGSTTFFTSATAISFGVETVFTCAWSGSTFLFKIDGKTVQAGVANSLTYTEISNPFVIGAGSSGLYGLPTNSEIYNIAMFNTKLTEAEMDSVHTTMKNRVLPPAIMSQSLFASALPANTVYARNSTATDVVNGVLTDYAANVPRVTPVNGFLSECTRTNSIRNGEAIGATLGVIGSGGALPTNWNIVNTVGLTVEVVASGTTNGFKYTDIKLSGTPTAGTFSLLFESATNIAALNTQVWTVSTWAGLQAGTLTNITSLTLKASERDSGGTEVAQSGQAFTPVFLPARTTHRRTLNNAGTASISPQIDIVVTAAAIDCTLRISSPQCERGAGATSYIRTTNATGTREGDTAYILTSNIPGFDQNKGTVGMGLITGDSSAYGGVAFQLQTGDASAHRMTVRRDGQSNGYFYLQCVYSYGLPVDFSYGQFATARAPVKVAMRYDVNNAAAVFNGGTVNTDTTFPTIPPSDRICYGGNGTATGSWNGYIGSFEIYDYAFTNAELQTLTTL